MKTIAVAAALAAGAVMMAHAAPWVNIPGTDLRYSGPGTVSVVTDSNDVVNILTNAPYGGVAAPDPATVVIIISNAAGGNAMIGPANKASSGLFAFFIHGGAGKIDIDCGQAKGSGRTPYVFADGGVGKIKFKGMSAVGKVVVDNKGGGEGVHIQNISKSRPQPLAAGEALRAPKPKPGPAGSIGSVITSGKLKRLQSNHGGFGGTLAEPGVIAIGEDSPNGQIKPNPKGPVAYVLICKQLASNSYDYAAAYTACIETNTILPNVEMTKLKKINAKVIGPAVIATTLENKIPASQVGKRVKLTQPIVGEENLVE